MKTPTQNLAFGAMSIKIKYQVGLKRSALVTRNPWRNVDIEHLLKCAVIGVEYSEISTEMSVKRY